MFNHVRHFQSTLRETHCRNCILEYIVYANTKKYFRGSYVAKRCATLIHRIQRNTSMNCFVWPRNCSERADAERTWEMYRRPITVVGSETNAVTVAENTLHFGLGQNPIGEWPLRANTGGSQTAYTNTV